MVLKTIPWSVQDHLATPERQAGFLEAALELAIEERDPGFFAKALGEVAKARGIAKVAEATGLTRAGLYKALSPKGDPRLGSLLAIMKALDLQLAVKAPPRKPVSRKRATASEAGRKPRETAVA